MHACLQCALRELPAVSLHAQAMRSAGLQACSVNDSSSRTQLSTLRGPLQLAPLAALGCLCMRGLSVPCARLGQEGMHVQQHGGPCGTWAPVHVPWPSEAPQPWGMS